MGPGTHCSGRTKPARSRGREQVRRLQGGVGGGMKQNSRQGRKNSFSKNVLGIVDQRKEIERIFNAWGQKRRLLHCHGATSSREIETDREEAGVGWGRQNKLVEGAVGTFKKARKQGLLPGEFGDHQKPPGKVDEKHSVRENFKTNLFRRGRGGKIVQKRLRSRKARKL